MPRRRLILVAACVLFFSPTARASELIWDPVYRALGEAGKALGQGADRMEVAEKLSVEVRAAPDSHYFARGRQLVFDLQRAAALSESAANQQEAPAMRLVDSRLPNYLLQYWVNKRSLENYQDGHPNDPAVQLLAQGRGAIPDLLPQLRETAVTRSAIAFDTPRVARCCDLALLLIENISGCRFHFNASTGELFHELSDSDRNVIIEHIELWWVENGAKSIADGIKWQIPHAEFYEKADMAERLIEIGRAEGTNDDEFGMDVLLQMFHGTWGHSAANIATRLAKYGDLSPVDVFYDRWNKSLNQPGRIYDGHVVFYLAEHGSRREWELLYEMARRELHLKLRLGIARIWPAVVNSNSKSPFKTPCLGMILTDLTDSASRESKADNLQSLHSSAESVVDQMQSLTGEDFGYRPRATKEQKLAAIDRAQQWWDKTGRSEFSFERIEARLNMKE